MFRFCNHNSVSYAYGRSVFNDTRLVRLLRITRLVTKSRELRAIVTTLVSSIPSIFNILILLSILFFIYAIVGYNLFRNVDPEHRFSFLTSLTTLFQVLTLEGWPDLMEPIVTNLGPLYWLYFVSFIVIGTFIIINLFTSVIVRKSEEAYHQVRERFRNTFNSKRDYARDKRDPQNLGRSGEKNRQRYRGTRWKNNLNFFCDLTTFKPSPARTIPQNDLA